MVLGAACSAPARCDAMSCPARVGGEAPVGAGHAHAASPQALHHASPHGLQVTHCHLPVPQISNGTEEGEGD